MLLLLTLSIMSCVMIRWCQRHPASECPAPPVLRRPQWTHPRQDPQQQQQQCRVAESQARTDRLHPRPLEANEASDDAAAAELTS